MTIKWMPIIEKIYSNLGKKELHVRDIAQYIFNNNLLPTRLESDKIETAVSAVLDSVPYKNGLKVAAKKAASFFNTPAFLARSNRLCIFSRIKSANAIASI